MIRVNGLTRRRLLELGLGATQAGLLGAMAWSGSRSRARAAAGDGPTKLLTLFLPGGWIPTAFFVPLSAAEITERCRPYDPGDYRTDATYYRPDHIQNLDGSGDALEGEYQRIRVPVMWDAASMSAGINNTTSPYSPWGWAWVEHRLWENACVVHGIDQGTASHASGVVSALCGLPGSSFRAPALHARVASHLYDRFGDSRPVPAVSVSGSPYLDHLGLPSYAAPLRAENAGAFVPTMSERLDSAWANLRDRSERPQVAWDGSASGALLTNEIDEYTRAEALRLRGRGNLSTDAFYQQIYDNYGTFSRRLALDIVDRLERTTGFESTTPAFWRGDPAWTPWAAREAGATWSGDFDLALRLLKSDLTSAVSLQVLGTGGFGWDTHGDGFGPQSVQVRATMDVVGRLLGEMKATPVSADRSLLDDTLVVILSDFARTWPNSSKCDHWPVTSVVFAGGGIMPNRMVGSLDWTGLSPAAMGPNAGVHPIVNEDGDIESRPLKSSDVIHTVLRSFGVEGAALFTPGGPGEITGVLS
jgi:hypothetical protein